MAKTKEEKKLMDEVKADTIEVVNEKVDEAPKNGPTYDELLKIISNLATEIEALKSERAAAPSAVLTSTANDTTDKILEMLSNKKADKEIVIVHNREMLNGLCTAIALTGLNIEFRALGEERTLSWQQFEECVSKYRRFFEKEIILLGEGFEELSQRYSVPCVKRGNNHVFTRQELLKLPKMDIAELEKFFTSLTKQDKEFVCSYWLGKCYDKSEGFYDRYKIELLNRLNGGRVFDNLLTLMNGDFRAD